MVDSRPRRSIGTIVKLVVFSLTPAIVLLILMEVVASVSIHRRGYIRPDSTTRGSIYTMRIGRWPWSRASVTRLNSLGYPDVEFPQVTEKKECLHIVVSGDSYAAGDGVDGDSSFVSILRRRAAERSHGRCIRVFNLGVRGTTIDQQADRIRQTMDRLKPDIVVLAQYQNDLTDLTNPGGFLDPNRDAVGPRPDSIRVSLRIFRVNTIKWLTYHAFAFMIRNGITRDELRHWSVMANPDRQAEARRYQETYEHLYAALIADLSARGIAFGVVILPSKLDVLARKYPEESFFRELARKYGVPHLRLFPTFDATRTPYAYLMYDGHLNEQGNRLVANGLYQWLFETQPAPFPALLQPPAERPLSVR
jgi:hypothetical protein